MKGYKRVPSTLMRGGTSKGLIINMRHLPEDSEKRIEAILQIYGSPDDKQIDGIGGGTAVTSKVALVEDSHIPEVDIVYTFGQVSITEKKIDFKPTCGNISTAVGLYAVEEGYCELTEPTTIVKILNTNINKLIEVEVPVKNGEIVYEGDFSIAGVPGTASRINVNFLDSGGAITGKLLPTGNVKDEIKVKGKVYEYSVIDSANTVILLHADQFNLKGTEVGPAFNQKNTLEEIENVRVAIGKHIGLIGEDEVTSPATHALPKIALIAAPEDYINSNGIEVKGEDVDVLGRYVAMGKLHGAFAVSGGIALATGLQIPGTVVHDILPNHKGSVKIGHPSGVIEVEAAVETEYVVKRAAVGRTARRIMEGACLVSAKFYE